VTATEVIDPDALQDWLSDAIGRPIERVELELLPQGHANGAWRIVADTPDGTRTMVLKAPRVPSIVHALDPCREARVVDALGRAGAPVPAVVAIDAGAAVGRPCFVMEWVEGRSVPDAWPNAYHDGWFLDAGADAQRATWDSFHDALAAVHRVALAALDGAYDGPRGARAVLASWREALLAVADASLVPRHLAVFDWLQANVPASADVPPALCMGDARLVNAIVDGSDVAALVDFEVAYVGNPIGDVGYSLFLERSHGHTAPLPGLPSEADTWARWSAATGRELVDLDYWMAFAATIIVVTASRAGVMWGPPDSFSEDRQGLLSLWESVVEQAAR
jgi:aminoglycoside phosphotransferase (APT) family kinase protein